MDFILIFYKTRVLNFPRVSYFDFNNILSLDINYYIVVIIVGIMMRIIIITITIIHCYMLYYCCVRN